MCVLVHTRQTNVSKSLVSKNEQTLYNINDIERMPTTLQQNKNIYYYILLKKRNFRHMSKETK
jgi:hypothetical protein